MKNQIVENTFTDLLPKREEYLNSQQLVAECGKLNIPISRKTIHNYIKDGLLPRPLHVAKEALFHKKFILEEIKAIHILKSIFHVDYRGLKELASNKYVNLQEITSYVHSIVGELHENNAGKVKERPLLINLANEKFLQRVTALFLQEIRKGVDPRKMEMGKFISDAFDKVKG